MKMASNQKTQENKLASKFIFDIKKNSPVKIMRKICDYQLSCRTLVVGEFVMDAISFQKIFGLCGLKGHIVEIWRDVTLVDGQRTDDGRTECEDRARILETEFTI